VRYLAVRQLRDAVRREVSRNDDMVRGAWWLAHVIQNPHDEAILLLLRNYTWPHVHDKSESERRVKDDNEVKQQEDRFKGSKRRISA
jgi:hypothetical protein